MTPEQNLMSALAKAVFRLNGKFLAVGEELARSAGMTASWWLVLGTALSAPRSVADIGREVGVTRQSIQRTADLLVRHGLAEYLSNPAHRRAKLLAPTEAGRAAIRRIAPAHRSYSETLVGRMGRDEAAKMLAVLRELSETLDSVGIPSDHLLEAG